MERKDFVFGMCLHNRSYASYPADTLERNLDFCKEMGLNFININFVPDTEEELEYYKSVAEAVHKRGMKIVCCIDDRTCFDMSLDDNIEEKNYLSQVKICQKLKGLADIYEVGPEFDVPAMHTDMGDIYNIIGDQFDGMVAEEYDPSRLAKTAPAVRGRLRAIREIDPDAKTMVAFAWWHTYYLEYLTLNGCVWDIIGVDWYSDAEQISTFGDLMGWLGEHYPNVPVLITETNYWGYNYKDKSPEECETAQRDWICSFTEHLYNSMPENFMGVIYYELMDEPVFEGEGFHGEAHFGFYKCSPDGSDPEPKLVVGAIPEMIKKLTGK